MQLTFTRYGERRYATVVARDDGVTLHVPSFDQPTWLPHDLSHYVVERALGLTQGFWGAVAAGAVFPGMKILKGRQAPHAAERSRAIMRAIEVSQQATEAEVLVDFFVHLTQQGSPANGIAQLCNLWRPIKAPPRSLQAHEVQQVCRELQAMHQQWQALALEASITVFWEMPSRRRRVRSPVGSAVSPARRVSNASQKTAKSAR